MTVYDANNCFIDLPAIIAPADSIKLKIKSYADANCTGKRSGEIGIEVYGGVGPYQYEWSNGSNTETINELDAGVYTVTVTDNNGCQLKFAKAVIQGDAEIPAVPTNAFSPNGDGINDYWVIQNLDLYPDNEVVVVNRWGNEIYSRTNYDNSWNGSKLSEGTYFYILKYEPCGKPVTLQGYVTIIR